MRVGLLDKDVFDHIFSVLVKEKMSHGICIIATRDFAKKLWKMYRIPYKAKADLVRRKMREWWNSYPWISEPRPHKKIQGVAIYLSHPMGYDYCMLEHPSFSLISVYQDQKEFK